MRWAPRASGTQPLAGSQHQAVGTVIRLDITRATDQQTASRAPETGGRQRQQMDIRAIQTGKHRLHIRPVMGADMNAQQG